MKRTEIYRKRVRFLTILGGAMGRIIVFLKPYGIENVLVLDYYHGEVKKVSVKHHWITTLRKAKILQRFTSRTLV